MDKLLLIDSLEDLDIDYDSYLINGFQGSSISLKPTTFTQILSKVYNKTSPFKVGGYYTKNDIYQIMDVPEEKQNRNWNTGYTKFGDDIFILANIKSPGRTGHDYDNMFIGDELNWYVKNSHTINASSIQFMLNPKGNI